VLQAGGGAALQLHPPPRPVPRDGLRVKQLRGAPPPAPPPTPTPQPTSAPTSKWHLSKLPVVECNTSQGAFAIEVHPEWAPRGAERYLQLVESGFFTHNLFYRVPPRTHPIVQFGLCPDPQLRRHFGKIIPDDPPVWRKVPIRRGMLAFAGSPGPPSRSQHMWFAIEGRPYMGHDSWEPPVGIILGDGANVLDRIRPTGPIDTGRAISDPTFASAFPGEYLRQKPVEWFEGCRVAWDPWASREKYVAPPLVCPLRRDCTYSAPIEKSFIPGCVDGCRAYGSYADAKAACDSLEACGGFIKSGSNHFEIRSGDGEVLPSESETAFLKEGPKVPRTPTMS